MEPETHALFGEPVKPEEAAVVSIAISLKRIADAICYQDKGLNIFDFLQRISSAAEEGIGRR